jgi:hypothetical protein
MRSERVTKEIRMTAGPIHELPWLRRMVCALLLALSASACTGEVRQLTLPYERATANADSTIIVEFFRGACDEVKAVTTEFREPNTVVVTVMAESDQDTCTAEAIPEQVTVDAPAEAPPNFSIVDGAR